MRDPTMTPAETARAAFAKHWPNMEGCTPEQLWLAACTWSTGQTGVEIRGMLRSSGLSLRPHSGATRAIVALEAMLKASTLELAETCNRLGREAAGEPPVPE